MPGDAPLSARRARIWRARWEAQQDLHVPDREVRFEQMLDWLEAVRGRAPRCLDLGCGTGAITERVLRRFPRSRVVAIDWDPVTRRLGEVALGSFHARVRWLDADLRSPTWVRGLPAGSYDAALSSTALHWLEGPELARLYRHLARRLRPGGLFLNADRLSFDRAAPTLRKAERALPTPVRATGAARAPPMSWDEWWEAVAREPGLAREMAVHRERFPHEHLGTPTPDLRGHVRHLRAAGFREVEVVYARGASRVLAAVR